MIAVAAALWLAATPATDIERAHELIGSLECDEALALGRAIAEDSAASEAEAREGRLIAGYCLAAVGRVSDAEEQFHAAVTEDVRVEAGFPMEHRVQYLLDAARADVLLERERRAVAERAALAAQVELLVEAPGSITGGQRASFVVYVAGPASGRVTSLKLQFRRPADAEFYSLPVRRGRDGAWRGEIGGIYTGSTRAYSLQWFVSASDAQGELVSYGSRMAPHGLSVATGSSVAADLHARERLPPVTRLLIAAVGAPASVLAATALNLAVAAAFMPRGQGGEDLSILALGFWMLVPATMAGAEAITTMFLLENDVDLWPAVVVGGVGALIDVWALIVVLFPNQLDALLPRGLGDLEDWLYAPSGIGVAVLALVTGAVGGAVPTAMILWEAGQYVE